jgi:hypothetical protein
MKRSGFEKSILSKLLFNGAKFIGYIDSPRESIELRWGKRDPRRDNRLFCCKPTPPLLKPIGPCTV